MKQLIPTSLDEYIAEHKAGDKVSGRVVELSGGSAVVELGEGIRATCRVAGGAGKAAASVAAAPAQEADLSSLTSMLQDRWKGKARADSGQPEALAEGQIRGFRIAKVDAEAKRIEVELA